jgi:hypothetical protein
VGNILDVVLRVRSDENLSLVGPPPPSLTKIIFPINYVGEGGVPHTGYPVTQFGYPGQPGKADVMHEPRIGVARAPLRGPWWI